MGFAVGSGRGIGTASFAFHHGESQQQASDGRHIPSTQCTGPVMRSLTYCLCLNRCCSFMLLPVRRIFLELVAVLAIALRLLLFGLRSSLASKPPAIAQAVSPPASAFGPPLGHCAACLASPSPLPPRPLCRSQPWIREISESTAFSGRRSGRPPVGARCLLLRPRLILWCSISSRPAGIE